jgi:hypothetical protein
VVVARVTDGERRFGRLLDLDLKRYLNRKLYAKETNEFMRMSDEELAIEFYLDRLDEEVE